MTLSIDMVEKTFIYGDSFSNLECLRTMSDIVQEQMWYAPFVQGRLIDRTKPGKSPLTMFLQATHDALTEQRPVRMIVALGACVRLPVYTDGWYDEERLGVVDPTTPWPSPARKTTLTDCEPYFDRVGINRQNTQQFHPTMLWANIYKNISDLHTRCDVDGHQLMVLHMNTTPDNTWINKQHPLVRPLCEHAESLDNYITEKHSCNQLCRQQKIQPLDYHTYGWDGHHGPEGQQHFGARVSAIVAERRVWN